MVPLELGIFIIHLLGAEPESEDGQFVPVLMERTISCSAMGGPARAGTTAQTFIDGSLEAAGRGAWLVSGSVDAVVISDRTL